jgi:hypothetical protein
MLPREGWDTNHKHVLRIFLTILSLFLISHDRVAVHQYANGWLFVSRGGAPPDGLHRVLDRIAREWQEELLEFEAPATEISAFWDEWGGREIAATIAKYLRDLAGA